jgi:hypothetical protein
MMLSVLMIGMTFAQEWEPDAAKMLVEPAVVTANPGDTFWVDVNIEKITDLYGFEFKLGYESGTKVVGALTAEEGGFLWGPEGTAFTFSIDKIEGFIHVGGSILGDWPGVTGTGTLARIQFVVGEGGDSPLELYELGLLDSNLDEMICQTRDGFFDGTNVEIVRVNLGARSMHVGDTATFGAKIINEGTVPMYARARFDSVRAEDGMTTTLWSNQSWQYPPVREPVDLYVDGFTHVLNSGWTTVGTEPWLDACDEVNYITSTTNGAQMRFFTFEDIALEGAIVDYVELKGCTDGTFTEDVDYDIYDSDFNWYGSLYATGAPAVVDPRWTSDKMSDVNADLLTEEGINNLVALVYFYDPAHVADGTDVLDALWMHVVFKAGRAPDYPYADGFTHVLNSGWTTVGTEPWLDAEADGNYVTSTTNGAQMRFFSFADVDVGTGVIDYVQLWGYTDGTSNEGIDYDVYTSSFDWLGSLYATGAPAWVTPRWVGSDRTSDILPALLTEAGINDLEVLLYFYDPDTLADGTDVLDALMLEVTYKADRVALPLSPDDYVIQPGEVLTLEDALWPLQPEDPGTYMTTVTVYYSFGGTFWNVGAKKVVTRSWWVK